MENRKKTLADVIANRKEKAKIENDEESLKELRAFEEYVKKNSKNLSLGEMFIKVYKTDKEGNKLSEKTIKKIKQEYPHDFLTYSHVEKELNQLIKESGYFPTETELNKKGYDSLIYFMKKNCGGISAVRKKMGYDDPIIKTPEQFNKFIQENKPAKNLALAANCLNGEGHDLEKILYGMYGGRFKDFQDVHRLIKEGLTNLGEYIGDYTLEEKTAIPLLVGQAFNSIPEDKISYNLEGRLIKMIRNVYSPLFNKDSEKTLEDYVIHHLPTQELKEKAHYYISDEYLEDLAKPNKKLFERIEEELFV